MVKIPFNKPPFVGMEFDYVKQAVESGRICGDGTFNLRCHEWLEKHTGAVKALMTTSCTHALEMSARLCNIAPGDEVIMPSFTFVSTADAFVSGDVCPSLVLAVKSFTHSTNSGSVQTNTA